MRSIPCSGIDCSDFSGHIRRKIARRRNSNSTTSSSISSVRNSSVAILSIVERSSK
jgi:hypothetical protein